MKPSTNQNGKIIDLGAMLKQKREIIAELNEDVRFFRGRCQKLEAEKKAGGENRFTAETRNQKGKTCPQVSGAGFPRTDTRPLQSAPAPFRPKPQSQAPDPAEAALNFVRTDILESLAKIDKKRPALLDTVRIYLSGMVCGMSREA